MAARRASRRHFIKEGAVFAGGLAGGMAIGANAASGQGWEPRGRAGSSTTRWRTASGRASCRPCARR